MDYGKPQKFLIQHTEDHGNERFFTLYMLKVEFIFIYALVSNCGKLLNLRKSRTPTTKESGRLHGLIIQVDYFINR